MQERRAEPRQRVVLRGEILCTTGLVMDCAVRDLSTSGAMLSFANALWVPQVFKLSTATFVACAEVRWRKGHHVGVRFLATREIPTNELAQHRSA